MCTHKSIRREQPTTGSFILFKNQNVPFLIWKLLIDVAFSWSVLFILYIFFFLLSLYYLVGNHWFSLFISLLCEPIVAASTKHFAGELIGCQRIGDRSPLLQMESDQWVTLFWVTTWKDSEWSWFMINLLHWIFPDLFYFSIFGFLDYEYEYVERFAYNMLYAQIYTIHIYIDIEIT